MSLKRLIDVGTVSQLLKKKIINNEGVRILDCTYDHTLVAKKPDWKRFQNELYGNFEKLLSKQCASKELYLSGHIPEAPHICLDLAMFPSEYERYALYPPETFQEYVQMLGINDDEHLILYSRGKYGGMLHASKFAWLFKAYGHEKLSLIDGGYEQWVKAGFTIDRDDVKLKRGAWKAVDNFSKYNVKFEELEEQHGIRIYIEYVDDLNLLDARVRGQFEGTVPTECPPGVVGTHIPGFKNLPAAELIEDGVMKSPEKIKAWLGLQHFNPNRPTVVMCDVGIQSAMVAYAIETVFPRSPIKVYNGSIREMELRNPKRISATFENV
ncbi:rhodanese-like protein [Dictyocaulus viviparus]|uniref:Rhodanese-like protein n=1 Tax=Dictyocaulus viviparus TaxID=29172 RepID=A0A0D8XU98_DICVI|nr:rhodanese-like protein [Dictyocaulus viviparus]